MKESNIKLIAELFLKPEVSAKLPCKAKALWLTHHLDLKMSYKTFTRALEFLYDEQAVYSKVENKGRAGGVNRIVCSANQSQLRIHV